ADPEGSSAICAAGNPGMATAGSGDVLTGIAGAVLARRGGMGGTAERARLAVFLHATAGDLAASEMGETPLVATDIARPGLRRRARRPRGHALGVGRSGARGASGGWAGGRLRAGGAEDPQGAPACHRRESEKPARGGDVRMMAA